jgi:hypothetical protein
MPTAVSLSATKQHYVSSPTIADNPKNRTVIGKVHQIIATRKHAQFLRQLFRSTR